MWSSLNEYTLQDIDSDNTIFEIFSFTLEISKNFYKTLRIFIEILSLICFENFDVSSSKFHCFCFLFIFFSVKFDAFSVDWLHTDSQNKTKKLFFSHVTRAMRDFQIKYDGKSCRFYLHCFERKKVHFQEKPFANIMCAQYRVSNL